MRDDILVKSNLIYECTTQIDKVKRYKPRIVHCVKELFDDI